VTTSMRERRAGELASVQRWLIEIAAAGIAR